MRDYRKLEVGQRARELVLSVYTVTAAFPREERYGLAAQMRRAAVSVASNIAEGTGRGGEREFLHFLYLALGSATELAVQLDLATALGFLTASNGSVLSDRVKQIQRMLNRLSGQLRRKLAPGGPGGPAFARPLTCGPPDPRAFIATSRYNLVAHSTREPT